MDSAKTVEKTKEVTKMASLEPVSFEIHDFKMPDVRFEEKRKDWQAIATHILAFTLVLPFVIVFAYTSLAGKTFEMPVYYITLVSAAIGFYFGNRFSS